MLVICYYDLYYCIAVCFIVSIFKVRVTLALNVDYKCMHQIPEVLEARIAPKNTFYTKYVPNRIRVDPLATSGTLPCTMTYAYILMLVLTTFMIFYVILVNEYI